MGTKFKFQKLKHLMWPRCMSVVGWMSLNWNSSIFAFPHCNIKWLKSKFQSEYHKNPFTLRNAFIFIHNFDWIRHWTGMWEHLFWSCVKMKTNNNSNAMKFFYDTSNWGGERKWNIQSHTFTISMEINWNLNRWHVTDACFSDKYVPNHIVAFEYIPRHLNDFSCGISICAMHVFGCKNMLKQKLITCIHEIRLTITVTFTHRVKNKNKNINISQ